MEETSKWRVSPRDREHAGTLSRGLKVSGITAQLLLNRGIRTEAEARNFLRGSLGDLEAPGLMRGIPEASALIRRAIASSEKIRIFGDYDVDGVTSTVLLLTFLRRAGADVDYYIPHRLEEGYGLAESFIETACRDGVSLIVTVDCGVSDHKEVVLARKLGMSVIITDHHETGDVLPGAQCVVNPRNPECPYPFKEFAGVGVVFKLVQRLCEDMSAPFPEEYLDLVTLGTVGDAVPLVGENRIMVRAGLKALQSSPSPGILSLLEMSYRRSYPLTARDLSCSVIPRINAAGRLERADAAVQLLMCGDLKEAVGLAQDLDDLNRRRQKIEERIRQEVLKSFETERELKEGKALVMASGDWHPGVLGITAYRVSEIIGKPVFLIALKDGVGRGSARTANGINLFEAMTLAEDLFLHYGGHSAAGGFGIMEKDIPVLKTRLEQHVGEGSPASQAPADMEISLNEIDMETVKELKLLEPFGEGNPSPLFLTRGIRLSGIQAVGEGTHLKLMLGQDGRLMDGIAFNRGKLIDCLFQEDLLYDLIVAPEIDTYRGNSRLCARIVDIMYPDSQSHLIISSPQTYLSSFEEKELPPQETFCIIDSRNVHNRIKYVNEILKMSGQAILVVRTSHQMKALGQSLRNKGIESSAHTPNGEEAGESRKESIVISLPGQIGALSEADDVLFFYPPPSLVHFQNPLYRQAKRVHFLFGEKELIFEDRLQEISEPTYEKIRLVQTLLNQPGSTKYSPHSADRMVRALGDPRMKKITVEIILKILGELGILRQQDAVLCMNHSNPLSEKDLSASRLYNSLLQQRNSFKRFKDLYAHSFDELKLEILARAARD